MKPEGDQEANGRPLEEKATAAAGLVLPNAGGRKNVSPVLQVACWDTETPMGSEPVSHGG